MGPNPAAKPVSWGLAPGMAAEYDQYSGLARGQQYR